MRKPKLPQETIEAIKGAPASETQEAVAERLGVSVPTVKKYRREGRQERQEIAREVVARHVEENIPDALKDLTDLRRLARGTYEVSADPRDGALWLNAIKTTLEHVTPDDAALDAEIERELAALADEGEGAPSGPPARQANGSTVRAY
jgi:transcriptional regulator with XRE-family HTH domain